MFKIKSEGGKIVLKKTGNFSDERSSSSDVKIMRKKLKNITSLSDKEKTEGGRNSRYAEKGYYNFKKLHALFS